MVIKASAATEIRALVAALGGDDDVQREAAVARLSVIGARAADRLHEAYAAAPDRRTHLAILRALEAIADDRSAAIARRALSEGGDIGVAATAVLRVLLPSPHAATASLALDVLIATALDTSNDRRLRLAAFDALQDTPANIRERVEEVLRRDDGALRDIAGIADRDTARLEAVWSDAVEGTLPEKADDLREALGTRGAAAPLNTLRAMIDTVRAHEGDVTPAARASWLALRGALHQTLALRGSRVALYDLRETLDATPSTLPTSFLAALHVLGDAGCLEPVAATWAAAGDARWKQQLEAAFRAIAQREKVTKRHAVMKRIMTRWPALS